MFIRPRSLVLLLLLACSACQEKDAKTVAAPIKKEASFEQRGKASFYARKFHGKETASGETFNNNELVAAHKTLPLGTRVKVTTWKTIAPWWCASTTAAPISAAASSIFRAPLPGGWTWSTTALPR